VVSAVIVAAGKGERFGRDKIFLNIAGRPLIFWTLLKFEETDEVDEIILVLRKENLERGEELKQHFRKLFHIVLGGKERGDSVFNGLKNTKGDRVLIHDGARPLVSSQLIKRVIKELERYPAVVPCMRIPDTVKNLEGSKVQGVVDRNSIVAIQTPQGFKRDLIFEAYKRAIEEKKYFTDDSSLLEEVLGIKSHCVEGEKNNIKITYEEDIKLLEAYLMKGGKLRIGIGFDSHRLVEGRKLFIGGVEIPSEKGALGHSDGDALIHAIIDAILGASGQKDIGVLFPDTDDKYRGISSITLLEKVREIIENEFEIVNIDSVVKLERPKISEYIPKMKKKIAEALKIPEERINIKGKTGEKTGPVGEGKLIEAQAVCLGILLK